MKKTELDEDIPIKTVFENIIFSDDNKEYEFEIYIPQLMSDLKFSFNCEITNSKGEEEILIYKQDTEYLLDKCHMYRGFFYKCGKKYFYENLGRNGEKKSEINKNIRKRIQICTNYYFKPINIMMKYDKEGKLNLGELKNVTKIKIDDEKEWYELTDYSKYYYPKRIDIIEGENFTLPLYSNKEITLDNDYFILYECLNFSKEPCNLMDIKKEIILTKLEIGENGDCGYYYEFKMGLNLKKGKYHLIFGEELKNEIIIIVNEGMHWMKLENYIINHRSFIENSENKTPIYLKKLKIDKKNDTIKFECSKTRRNIKYTHANIYLFQYQNPNVNIFFD